MTRRQQISPRFRFGERIRLTDGSIPVLRDCCEFDDGCVEAFVEHDTPRPWTVRTGEDAGKVLGHSCRLWVAAPGYSVLRDKDGCKAGIVFTEGNSRGA